jgi:quercetin dioxygenase-like cupin family protein
MANVPDVLVAASNAYKLLLENDKVRVMEVMLKPGQKAPMHNHPNSHVVYVKMDSRLKLTFPDGKDNTIDLKAGQTLWLDAGPHEAENVGKTDFDNLVIEVKK